MDVPVTPAQQAEAVPSLYDAVKTMVLRLLEQFGDKRPVDFYNLSLEEFERPFFETLMKKTGNNQSAVTRITGLARGTVRKKLKQYGLMDAPVTPVQQAEAVPSLYDAVKTMVLRLLEQFGDKRPIDFYKLSLEEFERPLFEALMEKTGNNQSAVTRILGLARGTIRKKLKQYGLID